MPVPVKTNLHPHFPPQTIGALSPWQRSTREHPFLHCGEGEDLPESADVIIIGSGLCGASIAHTLLSDPDRPKSVVMLEAREICSGATGRNAGHCRPDPARGFYKYSHIHGEQAAREIMESETVVLDKLDACIKRHDIQCDWNPRETLDICLSEEFEQYSAESLQGIIAAGGTPEVDVLSAEETRKKTNIQSAVGAYRWRAATVNPAKLTLGMHALAHALGGYQLFSHCPVYSVNPDGTSWEVVSAKGSIKTTKVVYATNAYTDALVPELEGIITPRRVQALHLPVPPFGLNVIPPIKPSYSLRFQHDHSHSVGMQPDKTIVVGTGGKWPEIPPVIYSRMLNTVDDEKPSDEYTENTFEAFCRVMPDGGWRETGLENAKKNAWCGIIAMTPDDVPLIGELPGKPGQYVAAGYNGHGMARIMVCGPALARHMLRGTWDSELPRAYILTLERLAHLQQKVEKAKQVGF